MKRTEVKEFIQSGIDELGIAIDFGTGRISEFNSDRSRTYPCIWMEPLETKVNISASGLPYDDWSVVLHIAKKDAADSKPEDYEALVDSCDEIAQQLAKKYNDIVSGYKTATLSGISRKPFIKKNADELSGVILSFSLKAPDSTNWC
jgi:hypothetical protein